MSIEGAKGSLRVEREKRGRRRRKGREGGKAGRESKHSGEKAKGQMLVLPEEDTPCGEGGPCRAGRRGKPARASKEAGPTSLVCFAKGSLVLSLVWMQGYEAA